MTPFAALDATDGTWANPAPPALRGATAIHDVTHERMVIFGGSYGSDTWALSLSGAAPSWTQLLPTGAAPSGRSGHVAIHDPLRNRMIVFGGVGSSYTNDVWALDLSSTPSWVQLAPTGTPPTGRADASVIYDPIRDRMIVFGGYTGTATSGEVWSLSLAGTPAWTKLTPTGTAPSFSQEHRAIYDPVRDRMIVIGGSDNTVRAMSLSGSPAWVAITSGGTAPTARGWHSVSYDAARDRIVLFGGYDGFWLSDTWVLSLAGSPSWTLLSPANGPPLARTEHVTIFDGAHDRLVMFGGYSGYSTLGDCLTLSFAGTPTWSTVLPNGVPPSTRYGHQAVRDIPRDRMLVYGGVGGGSFDVWALAWSGGPTWSQLSAAGSPPPYPGLREFSAIYDPVRERMIVFGGDAAFGFKTYLNDVWALSLSGAPTWTKLGPTGPLPHKRMGHSAIYDPVRDRMIVFGGFDSLQFKNDVWALSLSGTLAWEQLSPTGAPPSARYRHSAVYDSVRDRMVLFGGEDPSYRNDAWALSLSGVPAWTALTPSGTPPSPRHHHSAVFEPARDRMIVFGGGGNATTNDTWALGFTGAPAWTALQPVGTPPSARLQHSAVLDPVRGRMHVFGGYAGAGLNDLVTLVLPPNATAGVEPPSVADEAAGRVFPNPFRAAASVRYTLSRAGRMQVTVFDVFGRVQRRLLDGLQPLGTSAVEWDGTSDAGERLGAGIYFVRLSGPGISATRRVVLLK